MAATDDFTATTNTTGALFAGGKTNGAYQTSNDSDWFKITLNAGSYYRFSLSGGDSDFSPYRNDLAIYNSAGNYITALSTNTIGNLLVGAYKADLSGTYYLAVTDRSWNIKDTALPYTIMASAAMPDDAGETNATAKTGAVGVAMAGTFETGTDVDRIKLSLAAGTTYVVAANWNPDSPSSSTGNSLRIENAAGESATGYSNYYYEKQVAFTTSAAGDYYLIASADSRANTASTAYSLTVTKPADDFPATQAGAGSIATGTTASGVIDAPRDRDWFGTSLDAGQTYWFTLNVSGENYANYGRLLRVRDANGAVLAASPGLDGSSTKLVLPYKATSSGKYYVEVEDSYGTTNASGVNGKYTLGMALGEADDFPGDAASAAYTNLNSTIKGRIELPQDRDAFKIAVTKGKTYLFELATSDVKDDATLTLTASSTAGGYSGTPSQYYKPGTREYKVYVADYTGDYYLSVANQKTVGTSSYTLGITEAAADDYADNRATTGELLVGGKLAGKLDYTGDIDWVKVTLQSGVKYGFMLRGASSGEGTLAIGPGGAGLQVYGAGTSYSYVSLESRGGGMYTMTTTDGGDYYIGIRKEASYYSDQSNDGMGSYTLQAVSLAGDATAPTIKTVSPAAGATGVGLFDTITLTFDEPVSLNGGTIRLRNALGEQVESFSFYTGTPQFNGTSLLLDPQARLKPGTKYFLDLSDSGITDLAGNKISQSKVPTFTTVNAVDSGTAANDYLVGLSIGQALDGDAGTDAALYSGYRSGYTVTRGATETTVQRSGWNGSGVADKLVNVERLLFDDTAVALDIDGVAGQAYRLYQAAFNRAPDKSGLGYWLGQMDKGARLSDVAQSFINSAEFVTLNGAAPSDSAFVGKLYENVLHRAGEQAGIDYWSGVLASGVSRSAVLASFSESPENQAAVLKVIGNGFDYVPYG